MKLNVPPDRLGKVLIPAAWGWAFLVAVLTFWRAWDIPARLPDINEVATTHLFLFPVSMALFFLLSWLRQYYDDEPSPPDPRPFVRWRATLGIWTLALLHPVSCALYPAVFNLDDRTVDEISRAVGAMRVGMPRDEIEQRIIELNATLPISMQTAGQQHRVRQEEVARYLLEKDPAVRRRLWPDLARATLVFIPWGAKAGVEPDPTAREQLFLRRTRASSDIGVDKIRVRYTPAFTVDEIVYSSNRQLTMEREPCTVHLKVPAPPEASFPYPCTR
ncbi:MAG: hypothetical protein E6K59_02690 [Nitrospirae bacterium]|nr:MAG: hypothetical protein E6K59_02690 [Nitrospirota bacterium]